MAFLKKSKRNSSDLEAELHELRKFKQGVENRGAASSKVKVFLAKLWAGPELSKSLEAWMMAKDSDDSGQTITTTANLIAAILRRLMRVSFIFILLASIPIILIIWQNIIMERQNQSLIKQIEAQRASSSNQQVTEYLRLLLSSEEKEVTAAKGFLVSDVVNRGIAVERLAALIQSGNSAVQCSALSALSGIVGASPELTLKEALAPQSDDRAIIRDLQCDNIDFSGVEFGPITFLDIGLPQSTFKFSNVSEAEFQGSNLRHSDFSDAQLCRDDNRCVSFLRDTDLSYSSLVFTNRSKDIFESGMILTGAQMTFGQDFVADPESKNIFRRPKQVQYSGLIVPKISQENKIASGVCYETAFSQCYLYHKAKDEGKVDELRLSTLRQRNCPENLDGPIVLTSIATCKNLGLKPQWYE